MSSSDITNCNTSTDSGVRTNNSSGGEIWHSIETQAAYQKLNTIIQHSYFKTTRKRSMLHNY